MSQDYVILNGEHEFFAAGALTRRQVLQHEATVAVEAEDDLRCRHFEGPAADPVDHFAPGRDAALAPVGFPCDEGGQVVEVEQRIHAPRMWQQGTDPEAPLLVHRLRTTLGPQANVLPETDDYLSDRSSEEFCKRLPHDATLLVPPYPAPAVQPLLQHQHRPYLGQPVLAGQMRLPDLSHRLRPQQPACGQQRLGEQVLGPRAQRST